MTIWETNLVHLREYPSHRDVVEMSNLFFFHYVFIWSRGMTRSPRFRLSKRNEMNKITTASLARRKLYECVCTYLNQQIVKLIFITWLWTCVQSGGMKQTLYKHKIYFPAYWASPSIGIFFLYKHTLGK